MAVIISHSVYRPHYYADTAVELPGGAGLGCTGYAVDTDKVYAKKVAGWTEIGAGGGISLSADADANLLSLAANVLGLDNQSANKIFAGPVSGAAVAPAFRSLVSADIGSGIGGIKYGKTTHDLSVTGAQVISGIGFQPTAVFCFSFRESGTQGGFGIDDMSANSSCLVTPRSDGTAGYVVMISGAAVYITTANNVYAYAAITAFGADGWTWTWTKNGSPTGTVDIIYLAIK